MLLLFGIIFFALLRPKKCSNVSIILCVNFSVLSQSRHSFAKYFLLLLEWTAGGPPEWLGLQIGPLTNSPEMKDSSFFLADTPLARLHRTKVEKSRPNISTNS
jgi:hypothetical protein